MSPDQPLRIAWLIYRGNPHCGGQGVYTRYVARELAALGHTVEVFSGQPYPELDDTSQLTEVPSLDLYRRGTPFRERGGAHELPRRFDVGRRVSRAVA
jgi:hypothetical protein